MEYDEGQTLKGQMIRVTDDEGKYVVGCRNAQDNMAIRDYIKEHYKE